MLNIKQCVSDAKEITKECGVSENIALLATMIYCARIIKSGMPRDELTSYLFDVATSLNSISESLGDDNG